jgi:hypothetical protein
LSKLADYRQKQETQRQSLAKNGKKMAWLQLEDRDTHRSAQPFGGHQEDPVNNWIAGYAFS